MHHNQREFIDKWHNTPTLREDKSHQNLSGRGFTIILASDGTSARYQRGNSASRITFELLYKGYELVSRCGGEGCSALELQARYPKPYLSRPCNAMFLFMGLKEMGLAEIVGKGASGNPFRAVIRPL